MGVVASMFGKRSLFVYMAVISGLSILFGYLLDQFFSELKVIKMAEHIEELGYVDIASTLVLFGLILYYIFRRK